MRGGGHCSGAGGGSGWGWLGHPLPLSHVRTSDCPHRCTDISSYTQILTHEVTHTQDHLHALTPLAHASTHTASGTGTHQGRALTWRTNLARQPGSSEETQERSARASGLAPAPRHHHPCAHLHAHLHSFAHLHSLAHLHACFGAHLQACFHVHLCAHLHPFATSHLGPERSRPREQWTPHQVLHRCPGWAPSLVPSHHSSSQAHGAVWTIPNSLP